MANSSADQGLRARLGPTLALTVLMLLAALGVGWYLVGHIDGLRQENAALARFTVLLLLALLASVFLFGLLRTTGKLTGRLLNTNVEFGGSAALFLLIILLGLNAITPIERETLNLALQPETDETMKAVSDEVTALVDLGSYIQPTVFNATGMASIPNVPEGIMAARKVAVRVQSTDFRIVRAPGQGRGAIYLPILPDNRVDIPLERTVNRIAATTSPRRTYNECRIPAHGIEIAGAQETISRTSRWMDGGYDPAKWCNDVTAALRGEHPNADFRVANTGENKKSSCKPFNCPLYQYSCSVEVTTPPVYKLARSSGCGEG